MLQLHFDGVKEIFIYFYLNQFVHSKIEIFSFLNRT